MSYIDLINQFWRMQRIEPFSPYEVYLYLFLLNQCNIRGMENPFELKTALLYAELKMSKKAIYDARETLRERGLITYTEGERRSSSPNYRIIERVEVSRQRKVVRPKAKPVTAQIDEIPIPPEYMMPEPPTSEEISGMWAVQDVMDVPEMPTSVPENPETLPEIRESVPKSKKKVKQLDGLFKPEKPKKREKKEFIPPTLQEVEEYFIGKNVVDAALRAQQFFFHYDSLGWKTATGASVYRWDSLANKWLLNDKQKDGTKGRSISKTQCEGGDSYKQALYDRFAESERKFRTQDGDGSDVW